MSIFWVKFGHILVPKNDIRSVKIDSSNGNNFQIIIRILSNGVLHSEFISVTKEMFEKHRDNFENKPWWEWFFVLFFEEPSDDEIRRRSKPAFDDTHAFEIMDVRHEPIDEVYKMGETHLKSEISQFLHGVECSKTNELD